MSPSEAEAFVRELDRQRRIVEAQIARFVHQVAWRDTQGHWHHYRPDGTEIG